MFSCKYMECDFPPPPPISDLTMDALFKPGQNTYLFSLSLSFYKLSLVKCSEVPFSRWHIINWPDASLETEFNATHITEIRVFKFEFMI